MENSITLFGASGHGKVIIDILQSNSFPIELVVDDNPKTETLLGIPVLKVSDFDFTRIQNMIISIGNNKIRKTKNWIILIFTKSFYLIFSFFII